MTEFNCQQPTAVGGVVRLPNLRSWDSLAQSQPDAGWFEMFLRSAGSSRVRLKKVR